MKSNYLPYTDIQDYYDDLTLTARLSVYEEVPQHVTSLTTPKKLSPTILTHEFLAENRNLLMDYIMDRAHTIDVIMSEGFISDIDPLVSQGARDIIRDALQEIEMIYPCVINEVDSSVRDIITHAQEIFTKRLWI